MKITVLFENTVSCTTDKEGLKEGHGLCLYIETENNKILFDTGQNDSFIENAKILGIDLSQVDTAVISHGHYDHGGGLSGFLEINRQAKIYVNKNAFQGFYSGYEKYIGLDKSLTGNKRFILTDGICSISNDIYLTVINKEGLKYPMQNENMLIKQDCGFIFDSFEHEQYLVINEKSKKTVFSGCSHRGILNIAAQVTASNIVGGFHFSKMPTDEKGKETLESYARELLRQNTTFYTCHCTGIAQYEIMKNVMGNRLFYIGTGDVFEV